MKSCIVLISDGFEDIEAVAPIDVLNRVGVKVTVCGLRQGVVEGAYGIKLIPDTSISSVVGTFDAVVIPGGRRNAQSLAENKQVVDLIRRHHIMGKLVAAICASPSHVLGEAAAILEGVNATGDPGFDDRLANAGAIVTGEQVTVDGNLITGIGPGAALSFGLKIGECLMGRHSVQPFIEKWRVEI